MRHLGRRRFSSFLGIAWTGLVAVMAACSVYVDDLAQNHRTGAGGSSVAGSGGSSGGGMAGSDGVGGSAAGGGSGGAGAGEPSDASPDSDGPIDGSLPPMDARRDGLDAALGDSVSDDTWWDTYPPVDDASDVSDASIGTDDAGSDGSADRNDAAVVDAAPDADSGARDGGDGTSTGTQILPMHGTPIENADAGGPFDSRCASDEVVTGFIGRAGVQTDAIASTCSKLIGGALSSPRNLPLNGNLTGGNPFTVTCPANYVAVGIVGRYGHNTMWNEDVTTVIGVVCKNLTSSATQTVAITGQPALDSGYTTFREDCTGGRYLTDISGRTDGNSLGFTVGQVGGECELR